MKYILLSVAVLILNYSCNSQKISTDSLYRLIESLDNSSVLISYHYVVKLGLNDAGKKVCQNISENEAAYLIKNLGDKKKTLVIHAILSKNIELKEPSISISVASSKAGQLTAKLTYNNFTWIQSEKGDIVIEDDQLHNIMNYWASIKLSGRLFLHNCEK